jgi:hypothetical protein
MAGPITEMTPFQYWSRWALAVTLGFFVARVFLVQPIIDAIREIR